MGKNDAIKTKKVYDHCFRYFEASPVLSYFLLLMLMLYNFRDSNIEARRSQKN
jgi:hypothetical protein